MGIIIASTNEPQCQLKPSALTTPSPKNHLCPRTLQAARNVSQRSHVSLESAQPCSYPQFQF